jgi:hypothetical protein
LRKSMGRIQSGPVDGIGLWGWKTAE